MNYLIGLINQLIKLKEYKINFYKIKKIISEINSKLFNFIKVNHYFLI